MTQTTIYVATHKTAAFPTDPMYVPIQVGAELHPPIPGIQVTDDTGDNISRTNGSFNEITAMYWIWKNAQAEIVGLVHYRRLFYRHRLRFPNSSLLNQNDTLKMLDNADIILPTKEYTRGTLWDEYAQHHHIQDLLVTRETLQELSPDYLKAFDRVINRHWMYYYNMFITRKALFGEYMSWLMPILNELDNRIDTSSYDPYNSRVIGFLAERLFNVWIEQNQPQIIERHVYKTDGRTFLHQLRVDLYHLYAALKPEQA